MKTVQVTSDAFETLRGSTNTENVEATIARVEARLASPPADWGENDAEAARHTRWSLQAALAVLRTEGVVRVRHPRTGETLRLER